MNILKQVSIKHRIWAGFAAIIIILLSVIAMNWSSLLAVEQQAERTTNETVPAMIAAADVKEHITRAAQQLGYFLLSGDARHQKEAHASLQSASDRLEVFQMLASSDETTYDDLQTLDQDFETLKTRLTEIETLPTNQAANFPAMARAARQLNPLTQELIQLISDMIRAEADEAATPARKTLVTELGELRYTLLSVTARFRAFLAFRDPEAVKQANMFKNHMLELIDQIDKRRRLLTFEQEDNLAQIKDKTPTLFAEFDEIVKLHSSDRWRTDAYLLQTSVAPLIDTIQGKIESVLRQERERVNASNTELLGNLGSTEITMLWLAAVASAFGILIAVLNARSISSLVGNVEKGLSEMAGGNLTYRITEGNSYEETVVAGLMNNFTRELGGTIRQLQADAVTLFDSAEHLATITSSDSAAMSAQDDTTNTVISAMNEMAATVQDVARNAETAAGNANAANDEARSGALTATEAIGGIDVLTQEMSSAATAVADLETDCSNIGSVLDVIREIAEQTNLLALNAAIEAARAGDQGRGFAVVADEVRSLASRTQSSTEEIHNMIEKLQVGARNAVKAMEESSSGAHRSSGQVERTAESLAEIAGSVSQVNDLIMQIASVTEEQSAAAAEIQRNIADITALAEGRMRRTEQLGEASEKIREVAGNINRIADWFNA